MFSGPGTVTCEWSVPSGWLLTLCCISILFILDFSVHELSLGNTRAKEDDKRLTFFENFWNSRAWDVPGPLSGNLGAAVLACDGTSSGAGTQPRHQGIFVGYVF